MNAVMNLRFPINATKFLINWGTVRFSQRTPLHAVKVAGAIKMW